MRRVRSFLNLLVFGFGIASFGAGVLSVHIPPAHVGGQILVKLAQKATTKSLTDFLEQRFGVDQVQSAEPLVTDGQLVLVKFKDDPVAMKAIGELRRRRAVIFAEPDYIYSALEGAGLPNDPDFKKSWSLNNIGQMDSQNGTGTPGIDINVLPLWQKGITGNKNVMVAVIDTGVSWTNSDLTSNLFTNPGNLPNDTFKNDIHGWNFVSNGNDTRDGNGHGSHCAGIIGASGNDKVGITGINWNVTILPVQTLDFQGHGDVAAIVNSINYARMMKVQVINASFGGPGFSQAVHDAIQNTANDGILFVAAAGNDGANSDDPENAIYPAAYDLPNIIAVGAIDNTAALSPITNYGFHKVHIMAPGVNIWSTFKLNGYASLSGSSMAAPHVAGVAALMLSANPTWSYQEVKDRIIKSATKLPGFRSRVLSGGMLNATNAFLGIYPATVGPAESQWLAKTQPMESVHPYAINTNQTWNVSIPGAKFIRVHFAKVMTEDGYDLVTIEDKNGKVIETLTGGVIDYSSEYVEGDGLVVRFQSDQSKVDWGMSVDRVEYIMN